MYVCNVAEISESVGVVDSLSLVTRARHLIRHMPGGSQSILVRGDDEELYIVKFNNNRQGPNLLANEMLGAELLSSVGLPTPEWKPILITNEFLEGNSGVHFRSASGAGLEITSGIHFGTHFVAPVEGGEIYDFLPSSFLRRIVNPADFLGIYIFDVWANHHDHRQAVYSCRSESLAIDAYFIDNGHLFGGPHWSYGSRCGAAMCLDQTLYSVPWHESAINEWISHFEITLSKNLFRAVERVPESWYKGDIVGLAKFLEFRLHNLRHLFRRELRNNRRIKAGLRAGFSNGAMQVCDSRPSQIRLGLG